MPYSTVAMYAIQLAQTTVVKESQYFPQNLTDLSFSVLYLVYCTQLKQEINKLTTRHLLADAMHFYSVVFY